MTNFQQFLNQLNDQLNTLNNQWDSGSDSSMDLFRQIKAYEEAIALTKQLIAGTLTEAIWRELLATRNIPPPIPAPTTSNDPDEDREPVVTQVADGSNIAQATHGSTASVNINNHYYPDGGSSTLPPALHTYLWQAPDARYPLGRRKELDQLQAAYQTVRQHKGQIWLITGPPGHGKTPLAQALIDNLPQPDPLLVITCFPPVEGGNTQAVEQKFRENEDWAEELTCWERSLLHHIPLLQGEGWLPWLTVAAQLLAALPDGEAVLNKLPVTKPLTLILDLLKQVAKYQPLLLVLENLDQDRLLGPPLLIHWSRHTQALPVLTLVTLNTPYALPNVSLSPNKASIVLQTAKQLYQKGQVKELFLEPLTAKQAAVDIEDHTRSGLVARLIKQTGGIPSLLENWLTYWHEQDLAEYDADTGQWAIWPLDLKADQPLDTLDSWLAQAIEDTLNRLNANETFDWDDDDVRDLLHCAALEGPLFTAAAVATALDIEPAEDIIDLLDNWLVVTPKNPQGWFTKVGAKQRADTGANCWLYAFRVPLMQVGLLTQLDEAERQIWSKTLAWQLEYYYGSQSNTIAPKLARLFDQAGLPEKARVYKSNLHISLLPDNVHQLYYLIELAKETIELAEEEARLPHFFNLFELQLGLTEKLLYYNLNQALTVAQETLKTAAQLNSLPHRGRVLLTAGLCYFLVSQYEEAERLYRASLTVFEEIGDRRSVALTQSSLADLLSNRGQYEEAERLYRASLTVKEEIGDRREVAVTQSSLADLFSNRGQYEEAERLYRASLTVFEEIGDRRSVALTQSSLADLLRNRGQYEEAERLYKSGLTICHEVQDLQGIGVFLLGLGKLAMVKNQPAEAIAMFQEAQQRFEAIGLSNWAAQAEQLIQQMQDEENSP